MPTLDQATARALVARARVGRLATVTADGRPHVVPCCFALVGGAAGDRVVSVVDGKPKSTSQLRRLDNIRARPAASLLVDHYDDDWQQLWWVRVDGSARVLTVDGDPSETGAHRAGVDELVAKYEPYRLDRPTGPLVVIDVERVTSWAFGRLDDRNPS